MKWPWTHRKILPTTDDTLSDTPPPELTALWADSQLLDSPCWQRCLAQIASLIGLPVPHFRSLVEPAVKNYARFVQQLPASEYHHHAEPSGLLCHGLEVTVNALQLRRGHLLPLGAGPEVLARQQDLWTYAVLTAALLHDIGKPLVDQHVVLYDVRGNFLCDWNPLTGPMDLIAGCAWYRTEFVRERRYKLHERVAPLLLHHIVPQAGLRWLASESEVLGAWLATISGDDENAGALGQIVLQADRESVARNLGAGEIVASTVAPPKPLHEKLLTGLRHLLSKGDLPLNRNGAAGWLKEETLWLVSKRAMDALRAHLASEGHGDIPSSNERFLDVLQEHGILIPIGDRAIWRANVSNEGWSHELTLLRIPAQMIWLNPDTRPASFAGTVTPVKPGKTATQGIFPEDPSKTAEDKCPVWRFYSPRGSATNKVEESPANDSGGPDAPDNMGESFLNWLQEGLLSGQMEINTTKARAHVVAEGILLVSPGIFKDFAAQHPDVQSWNLAQKRFLKLKAHQKTRTGTNIFRYRVQGPRKKSVINGVLIPDPSLLFGDKPPPAPNPMLRAYLE